jgi:hypothetical protein
MKVKVKVTARVKVKARVVVKEKWRSDAYRDERKYKQWDGDRLNSGN